MVKVRYGVKMMASERGWGRDYWTAKFDTIEEAQAFIDQVKKDNEDEFKLTRTAPDYYAQTESDEIIVITE